MEQVSPKENGPVPTSRVLEGVLDQAPNGTFTFSWLAATLQERSFGILMVLLGLLAMAPVGSSVPGLLLAALAIQRVAGRSQPVLPRIIACKPLPTRHLLRVGQRAVPFLAQVEKAIYPRWPTVFDATKHSAPVVILLLTSILLLVPVPLSNTIPGVLIALISLAQIEEDGVLLFFTLMAAVILIGIACAAVWGAVVAAIALSKNW